jgi:23S rRNA pseudouridine2605 synthase
VEEKKLRLQVFLARSGVASRRASEELIKEGRVSINGQIVREMGVKVGPEDLVKLDKRTLHLEKNKIYIALHKPKAYLCSNYDEEGRPLALDLLQDWVNYRVYHVGRLDFLTSGLIFYTNDGEFAKIITHPANKIEKTYLIETKQPLSLTLLEQYKKAIRIEKELYKCYSFEQINAYKVKLVLIEGKNREIRKVFESWKIEIKRIHRIKIGIVELKGLESGQFRLLKKSEVEWFLRKGERNTLNNTKKE